MGMVLKTHFTSRGENFHGYIMAHPLVVEVGYMPWIFPFGSPAVFHSGGSDEFIKCA
jgi:hypothetical protein